MLIDIVALALLLLYVPLFLIEVFAPDWLFAQSKKSLEERPNYALLAIISLGIILVALERLAS